MKIGIVSDIHANAANLKRAIVLLRERGAETILCAGDVVDGATEGNEAAELVQAEGLPCVQGNHDYAISQRMPVAFEAWFKDWRSEGIAQAQFADGLSEATITFLRELPITRRFEWEGKRILLTHASTWDQVTCLYANGRRDTLERVANEADADAVIVGHTHIPMAVCAKHVWVFNPGSVDSNRFAPSNPTCAILTLPEMHYEVFDIGTGLPVQYVKSRI